MVLGRLGLMRNKVPCTDRGDRVYAIGDVHGRIDLLRQLFETVTAHSESLPPTHQVHVILLGDMIDRGPDSSEVLRFVHRLAAGSSRLVVLKGNHEELLLKSLDGYPGLLRAWMKTGGRETLQSFGVDPDSLDENPLAAARTISAAIPREIVDWLRDLPLTARSGDYFFCHAGVRPGVPIRKQTASDLLWIRDEFLSHTGDHGAVVVHGHSITNNVEMLSNRIGIDTGAYRSGVLTALYLEGDQREILSVSAPESDVPRETAAA